MTARHGGCRSRLIVFALGLTPILLLEVVLHLMGYGSEVVELFGPERPVFVKRYGAMELAVEHRRQFRTEPFLAEKAPGTTRIIVVGDSTAYGFTNHSNRDEQGRPISLRNPYPVLLERALAEKYPDRSFEVINCGGCECGTYRLRRVVREVLNYSPDIVIFLAGSSDFLEFRLLENWREAHPFWAGLRRHWKTLALARDLLRRVPGRPDRLKKSEQVQPVQGEGAREHRLDRGETVGFHVTGLFLFPEDVVKSREEAKRMLAHSVQNLEAVVEICREQSVPLILCTVPANLRMEPTTSWEDDPIIAQLTLGDVSEEAAVRFEQVTDRIYSLVDKGEWRQAMTLVDQAKSEFSDEPRVAMLYYLEGRAQDGLHDLKRARDALIRAKDLDPFLWRVPDGANQAVRRLSDREGVWLADIESAFMRALPDGIPDGRLFYDSCHYRPEGHAIAARELMAVLEREELLPER